jgi:methionyl aminopeptidase
MKPEEIEKIKQAGKIAAQTVKYARTIVKSGVPLKETAEKIEAKITELGGAPAFPVTFGINEMAAHATPAWNSESVASGLIKVDIGVHVDGFIGDTAFTIDLDDSEENKKLIEAAEKSLEKAIDLVKSQGSKTPINEIGSTISKEMQSLGSTAIQNLSGHSIEEYDVHAGITIPNYDNNNPNPLGTGTFAIEPFSTSGLGLVKNGKLSGIYHLEKSGNVRDPKAREVLQFIEEEYETLPFCSRWIYNKFGSSGLLALKRIEEANLLHHYEQLIEKGSGPVAQAEHTLLITDSEVIVTTKA